MGITKLSKVQSLMLDRYYSHNGDIMAVSETGSGKTLAYLLIALGRFYVGLYIGLEILHFETTILTD